MSFPQSYLKKHNLLNSNLRISIFNKYKKLFRKNSINICYNKFIPRDYDPNKQNVLLALESPAVIEYEGWLKPDMKFVAEISFANFYKLDNYYCCRDLYVNLDSFIDVKTGKLYENKTKLLSIISSHKIHLQGHKLRHQIIKQFHSKLDVFGSGYRKFGDITPAYTDYMFQIVIENGKHPEYVSEKLFYCLQTQTIPIYWGGETALQKMGFDTNGVIFFDKTEDIKNILDGLSFELYQKMKRAAINNTQRLIEIRNEKKMNLFLHSVIPGYMHTTDSYLGLKYNKLNLLPENMIELP